MGCGGVRGVGAGGIISSAFCLLYKLSTLKLTRKQVYAIMNHADSPYIRGLGFMYVRFTQPPTELMEWFEDYLDDEEVIDVKAGGGKEITIGEMVKQFLTKLEWFDTRFPRIPVPVQKEISDYFEQMKKYAISSEDVEEAEIDTTIDDVLEVAIEIEEGLDHQKEKNVGIMGQVSMIADQMIDTNGDRGQGIEIVQVVAGMKTTIKQN